MPPTTIHAGARSFLVTIDTANRPGHPYIELGVAGTNELTSTMIVQFTPDQNFSGNFVVMGRTLGTAADLASVPFVPVPYRLISLNDVAQTYQMVSTAIAGNALIQIPANGLSIVLMNGLDAGTMQLTAWDVNGSSAI